MSTHTPPPNLPRKVAPSTPTGPGPLAVTPKTAQRIVSAPRLPTAMSQLEHDTRSLVLHGQPWSGKTSTINALVEAGIDVHHIDCDGNNLSITCAEAPNYHWYPWRSQPVANVWNLAKQMMRTDSFSACVTHGVSDCISCSKAGADFYGMSLKALPPRSLVVFDSYGSFFNLVRHAVTVANNWDVLEASNDKINMALHQTVAALTDPVWSYLLKMHCDSLVLTHHVNRQNMYTANPKVSGYVPEYFYPLGGSGARSKDLRTFSTASAVWASPLTPIASQREFVTKAGHARYYAVTPDEFGAFTNMTPAQAIVAFYERGRNGVAPAKPTPDQLAYVEAPYSIDEIL